MKDLKVLYLETWRQEFPENICNYDKVQEYLDFIKEAVERYDPERYSEWHHIFPRCLDKNGKYNDEGVRINGADHLRAHMKLVECFNGLRKHVLGCAIIRMRRSTYGDLFPEEYEKAKQLYSLSQTGELNHAYGKINYSNGTVWITNGQDNKRIHPEDSIPEGWQLGVTKFSNEGMVKITDGCHNKYISPYDEVPEGWRYGCTQNSSDRFGENNSIYGKVWITDGYHNRVINPDDSLPDGWHYGATQNNPDQHGENSKIYGRVAITNGIKNRLIYPDEELPEGWRYGQSQDHSRTGCNFNEGKIYINNGLTNKMIKGDIPIPDGWTRGMLKRKKVVE